MPLAGACALPPQLRSLRCCAQLAPRSASLRTFDDVRSMHPVCCSWSFVSCDGGEEEEAPKKKSKGKGKGKKSEDRKSKKKCKYGRWKKRCAPRWACCGRLLGAGCAERAVQLLRAVACLDVCPARLFLPCTLARPHSCALLHATQVAASSARPSSPLQRQVQEGQGCVSSLPAAYK